MTCAREDEERKEESQANPPQKAAAVLVAGSKLFQFCEASEQAEYKEEHHFC